MNQIRISVETDRCEPLEIELRDPMLSPLALLNIANAAGEAALTAYQAAINQDFFTENAPQPPVIREGPRSREAREAYEAAQQNAAQRYFASSDGRDTNVYSRVGLDGRRYRVDSNGRTVYEDEERVNDTAIHVHVQDHDTIRIPGGDLLGGAR